MQQQRFHDYLQEERDVYRVILAVREHELRGSAKGPGDDGRPIGLGDKISIADTGVTRPTRRNRCSGPPSSPIVKSPAVTTRAEARRGFWPRCGRSVSAAATTERLDGRAISTSTAQRVQLDVIP
jgi:hypothetical protein